MTKADQERIADLERVVMALQAELEAARQEIVASVNTRLDLRRQLVVLQNGAVGGVTDSSDT